MKDTLEDRLMSVQEMANYLQVSKSSAYRIIRDLKLEVVFPTSDIRIRKSTVDSALLRSHSMSNRNSGEVF